MEMGKFFNTIPPPSDEEIKPMGIEEQHEEHLVELNEGVIEGLQTALELLRKRFEDIDDERERLPFHNGNHSASVAARTRKILEAIRRGAPDLVDERAVEIGQLTAAFHDIVQKWEPSPVKDGEFTKVLRKRLATAVEINTEGSPESYIGNEAASAEEMVHFMDTYNEKRRASGLKEIFTEDDKQIARRAIDATIPLFIPAKMTVVQPRLVRDSKTIIRAIALADLGEAGMDSESYARAGDALFREENLDILDGSIQQVTEKALRRESMSFEELLDDFGYQTRSLGESGEMKKAA